MRALILETDRRSVFLTKENEMLADEPARQQRAPSSSGQAATYQALRKNGIFPS
jgi:hypothetical protein